jgi:hypothetical protein
MLAAVLHQLQYQPLPIPMPVGTGGDPGSQGPGCEMILWLVYWMPLLTASRIVEEF